MELVDHTGEGALVSGVEDAVLVEGTAGGALSSDTGVGALFDRLSASGRRTTTPCPSPARKGGSTHGCRGFLKGSKLN